MNPKRSTTRTNELPNYRCANDAPVATMLHSADAQPGPPPRAGRSPLGLPTAMTDEVDDATVEAVGKLSEALECVERARGELYSFHQLMGHADLLLGAACDKLRDAGHERIADRLYTEMVGRNVLNGRWTFQIVEEFDDVYWSVFREHE